MVLNQVTTSTTVEAVDVMSNDNFAEALEANVNISYVKTAQPRIASLAERNPAFGHIQPTKGRMMGAEAPAKFWNIDHRKALNTVKMTTQRGVRHCLYPAMTRRFPTNDRMPR